MEQSVQRLMAAEKEVNEKVRAAQNKKSSKLKGIKEECKEELAMYEGHQTKLFNQ